MATKVLVTLQVEHPQKTLWTVLFLLIFGEDCIRSINPGIGQSSKLAGRALVTASKALLSVTCCVLLSVTDWHL